MLHLQNFDKIRIIFLQVDQSDHHTGKHCLNGLFLIAGLGELQGDSGFILPYPNLGLCAAHIIDGGFGHCNNGTDVGTDNVLATLFIAAVTGNGESCDSLVLGKKLAFNHINYSAILVISTLV